MSLGIAEAEAFGWVHMLDTSHARAVRSADLSESVVMFFSIANTLALSATEERILLDLTRSETSQLRMAPAKAFQLGGSKLERRVNYAIPIMRRMLAAIAA